MVDIWRSGYSNRVFYFQPPNDDYDYRDSLWCSIHEDGIVMYMAFWCQDKKEKYSTSLWMS